MITKPKLRSTKTQRRQMREVSSKIKKLKYACSLPRQETHVEPRRVSPRDEHPLDLFGEELKQFFVLKKRLVQEREVEAERLKQLIGHPYYLQPKELRELMRAQVQLNKAEQFERNFFNISQLSEAELKESRASMVAYLRQKNLLPPLAADGSSDPILWQLTLAFKRMSGRDLPKSKNYFALSLKQFFMNLSADQLDQICHQFVDGWVKDELVKQNQELKDMIEIANQAFHVQAHQEPKALPKKKTRSRLTPEVRDIIGEEQLDTLLDLPRYMAPTIGNARKKKEQLYQDRRDLKHHLRSYSSVEPRRKLGHSTMSGAHIQACPDKKVWMPTNRNDPSLESDYRRQMEVRENLEFDASTSRSISVQRAQQQKQLVDRLYREGSSKVIQQRYYADEKIRRETAECTFQPNHERRQKQQASYGEAKRLLISLYRSDNNTTEIGECKPSSTPERSGAYRGFNVNSDQGTINIEMPIGKLNYQAARKKEKDLDINGKDHQDETEEKEFILAHPPPPAVKFEQDTQGPLMADKKDAIPVGPVEKSRKRPFNPRFSNSQLPVPQSVDQIPPMEVIATLPPEADLFELSDSSQEIRHRQMEILRKAKVMLSKYGGSRTDRSEGLKKSYFSQGDVIRR